MHTLIKHRALTFFGSLAVAYQCLATPAGAQERDSILERIGRAWKERAARYSSALVVYEQRRVDNLLKFLNNNPKKMAELKELEGVEVKKVTELPKDLWDKLGKKELEATTICKVK